MLQHLSVHEPLERGVKHLAQAHESVDANDLRDAGLEATHDAHGYVGATLDLGLAPASSFAQHLDPLPDAAGQFAIGLSISSIGLQLSRHPAQGRHWQTTVQEGAGVQP